MQLKKKSTGKKPCKAEGEQAGIGGASQQEGDQRKAEVSWAGEPAK